MDCRIRTFVVTAASLFALSAASASAMPEVPHPSPRAKVEQRVGITDFSISYSSPGVKGRTIWGELVPYDELWRAGANEATVLSASRDFFLGDAAVPAGSYSLFVIPAKEGEWTVVLNSDHQIWGTRGYDAAKDVARIRVRPTALSESRERLTYIFSDATDDSVNLDLEWEKIRLRIPIRVDTKAHVLAEIERAVDQAWQPHAVSAKYLLDNELDLNRALELVEASIAIRPTWRNHWTKAQILHKLGKKKQAVQVARQAQKLGQGDYIFENFYAADVTRAIESWK